MIRRIKRLWRSGQKGQAMTETALLTFLLLALGVGTDWLMRTHPQMLNALDFYLGPVQEFAVVGDPVAEETRRVLRAVRGGFRANKVVALKYAAFHAPDKRLHPS